MTIECECCNTQKPNSEIRMYGKWICNGCKGVDEQKQKEVLDLLNSYIGSDNKRMAKLGLYDWPCPVLGRMKKLLTEMWGE